MIILIQKKLFFLLLMKSRTLIKKMFQIHKTKRIIGKINSFYLNSDFPKKIDKTTIEEYNKLRELRDTIFSEDFFTISDLREKIAFYPGKYLNIHLREIMSLEPINNTSIQNFQIEYSNKFFQFAINNRIKALENQIEIAYDYTKGSGKLYYLVLSLYLDKKIIIKGLYFL